MIKERQLSGHSPASHPRISCVVVLVLMVIGVCCPCGPGRGTASNRRPRRKMTPLVFMQHLPNFPEHSLGASGSPEGRIRGRSDPRSSGLVTNSNPDIVFKDEEGTGEDRIMTQRCKDRLNALAKGVIIQWPGLRLRVVNAWEANGRQDEQSLDSLHGEGRAVDITTSDRDRSKYGMLARLAVEAGFDWVFYESRSYVHCSVKADKSIAAKFGGCFPGSATVLAEDGRRLEMSHLSVGDRVLSVDRLGALQYSDVIAFLHRDITERTTFQRVRSAEGHDLTLTPDHMIFTARRRDEELDWFTTNYAADVQRDCLLYAAAVTDAKPRVVRVVNVSTVIREGVYAPMTSHGSVIVDGLVTSCYASFNSQSFAHLSMLPVRLAYRFIRPVVSRNSTETVRETDGVHWYARFLYQIAMQFLPRYFYVGPQDHI